MAFGSTPDAQSARSFGRSFTIDLDRACAQI
jgi:hypothetical protein